MHERSPVPIHADEYWNQVLLQCEIFESIHKLVITDSLLTIV